MSAESIFSKHSMTNDIIASRSRNSDSARDPSPRRDRDATPTRTDRQASRRESPAPPAASSGGSYASYKTAEDRAAFIKQQAEQRMAERLAALGLKPPTKAGETAQQRQEREAKERRDRVRLAEEEDAKRENERQQRLADEQAAVPNITKSAKKAPPTPPVRKSRADSATKRNSLSQKNEGAMKAQAEHEGMEKAIKEQQQVQASQTMAME